MKNEFPVVGLIYLPTSQQIVFNWENEVFIGKLEEAYADLNQVLNGLKKATIRKRTDPFKVLTSRNNVATLFENHINDLKMDHDNIELVQVGSAIKFYRMAAGEANQYPRFQGSMEWDIAAGQAISEALGFETIDVISKKRLKYNRPDLLNPHFIIRAV